jgi:PAS domain-containing protein
MIGSDQEWLEIFEAHFRGRRKGFLVFDSERVLRYISEYALEVLEAEQYQIGFDKLSDILTLPANVPDLLLDPDNFFRTVHDVVITTPAGRSKEIRVNFEQDPGNQGMVVWIEPRGRDITGTLKKISVYDQFRSLRGLFDGIGTGFLLLDLNGVVIEYNERIKHLLRLPGEWRGKVLFTYPPLQEKKIRTFIYKCLQEKKTVHQQKFRISYSSGSKTVELELTGMQISDPRGEAIGALICAGGQK